MTAYFISDCHLDPTHPEAIQFFIRFCQSLIDKQAISLTILGDFFEVWIGDDALEDWHQPIIDALQNLRQHAIPVYFIHGNRDFLLGNRFARLTGMQMLSDPCIKQIANQKTLLMHGDLLCADDIAYQRFRRVVRNPIIKTLFLLLPKRFRLRLAAKARAKSKAHTRQTRAEIMDVNIQTVNQTVQRYDATRLIHGHTHRPTIESLRTTSGQQYQRIVLGDWYKQASVLSIDADIPRLKTYAFDEEI